MKISFLITTRNRQESCQRLVDALQGQGDIIVLNDGCNYDIKGCIQYKQQTHRGKGGYWITVRNLWKLRTPADYYIMLPDDFLPTPSMVKDALDIWDSIEDPQKICLNLYADRIGQMCWTSFTPKDKGIVWLTQWVDMCFLCPAKVLQTMCFIMEKEPIGGSRKGVSSGVGAQLSRTLHRRGYNLYQVKESLAIPQQEHYISQMYAENNTDSNPSRKNRQLPTYGGKPLRPSRQDIYNAQRPQIRPRYRRQR